MDNTILSGHSRFRIRWNMLKSILVAQLQLILTSPRRFTCSKIHENGCCILRGIPICSRAHKNTFYPQAAQLFFTDFAGNSVRKPAAILGTE